MNQEFEVLYAFLDKLPQVMNPGGRIAILTFHSGEDRLVKRAFKEGKKAGIYSEICKDVIRPSAQECARNTTRKMHKIEMGNYLTKGRSEMLKYYVPIIDWRCRLVHVIKWKEFL